MQHLTSEATARRSPGHLAGAAAWLRWYSCVVTWPPGWCCVLCCCMVTWPPGCAAAWRSPGYAVAAASAAAAAALAAAPVVGFGGAVQGLRSSPRTGLRCVRG
eukprot:1161750-Pelagomonas_calceolata.AAC.8